MRNQGDSVSSSQMSPTAWGVLATVVIQLLAASFFYGKVVTKLENLIDLGLERDKRIEKLETYRFETHDRLSKLERRPSGR